jgi:3-methyladenine DNA glycosylase AlkD
MITTKELEKDLRAIGSQRSAGDIALIGRFFKSYKGGYSEGDVFIGVKVPWVREVCKKYKDMSLGEIEKALESPVHEVRLAAVIIMTNQASSKKASEALKKSLFDLYLRRTDRVNNWDIVDLSCRDVVGEYLQDKPRDVLYKLARSKDLWERRIAIVSTWAFIRRKQYGDTFKLAEILLHDSHDLIHKATGWMLRETGKRGDREGLVQFLDAHAKEMPRTMLRYAIEHFDPATRAKYMER